MQIIQGNEFQEHDIIELDGRKWTVTDVKETLKDKHYELSLISGKTKSRMVVWDIAPYKIQRG